jgi:hypothetical protein
MGQAKIKREREEARRREERDRQRSLRPRAWGPIELKNVPDPEKPGYVLGTFELHVDGRVYQVKAGGAGRSRMLQRVRDPRLEGIVITRYQEIYPPKQSVPGA